MANNVLKIKRTSVSGRAANTYTLTNPGELALNMTDGIMYSTNGSVVFEIGANNTNVRVTGNAIINAIVANGSLGTDGDVLTSNGSKIYWAPSGGATYVRQNFTADGSTTSFTVTGGYTPNNLDVYVNGVKAAPSEITISSGSVVVFGTAPLYNSVIEVIGIKAGVITYTESASYIRQYFTGDGSTTSFAVSGGYTANNIDVYINGVKSSYTELDLSSGSNVVFNVAPLNNVSIEVIGVRAGSISYITANVNAQYTWSNTQTFSNTITFNSTIVGTVNNALYLGGVAAASYVNTTNLTNNLANYQTTAGLSSNIATLTANNTSFVGSVSAANVVSNAQLQANLTSKVSTGKAIAMAIVFGG